MRSKANAKLRLASTVHREVEKVTKIGKFFESLMSPRTTATAQIDFLLLKAFYLSFLMDTSWAGSWRHFSGESATTAARARLHRAFQMPLELFPETLFEKIYMRFQWWQTVLLECDINLANSCCVFEKQLIF